MSERIYRANCCGCGFSIGDDGLIERHSKGDVHFHNMRQVREAAKNHRWFCAKYTGEFRVTSTWYVEVKK